MAGSRGTERSPDELAFRSSNWRPQGYFVDVPRRGSTGSAVAQCREHGLEFDAVNDNIPEIVEMYGVNSRKITADYYIDDKAVVVKFEKGKEHE